MEEDEDSGLHRGREPSPGNCPTLVPGAPSLVPLGAPSLSRGQESC